MSSYLNDKYCHYIIVDIINDSVMSCEMPRVSNTIPAFQWFRMSRSKSRMFF